jgi:hypothetical protein
MPTTALPVVTMPVTIIPMRGSQMSRTIPTVRKRDATAPPCTARPMTNTQMFGATMQTRAPAAPRTNDSTSTLRFP